MNIKGLFQTNKTRAILILFLLIAIAIFNTADILLKLHDYFQSPLQKILQCSTKNLDPKLPQTINEVGLQNDIKKFDQGIKEQINLDKLNISGGQRQKIVLARAKIHNSNIILIDEGTSAIDQNVTLNILKDLANSNATIFFIAHNFNDEMRKIFDREIHIQKTK